MVLLLFGKILDKFGIGEGDIAAAFTRKMNLIRDHLSLVFHRYLSGEPGLKKTDIRMNDLSIVPQDPLLTTLFILLFTTRRICDGTAQLSFAQHHKRHAYDLG